MGSEATSEEWRKNKHRNSVKSFFPMVQHNKLF